MQNINILFNKIGDNFFYSILMLGFYLLAFAHIEISKNYIDLSLSIICIGLSTFIIVNNFLNIIDNIKILHRIEYKIYNEPRKY